METLDAFNRLNEDVPGWCGKLDELSKQIVNQTKRIDHLSRVQTQQLFKRKTGSTESLRPVEDAQGNDSKHDDEVGSESGSSLEQGQGRMRAPQQPVEKGLEGKVSPRKRKPASSLVGASGPTKYRTKSMIIVYYDSTIQEGFEALVRSIASCRNLLRKGKLEAGYKARLASLNMEELPFPAGGDFGMLESRDFRPRLERKPVSSDLLKGDNAVPAVDAVDKHLETAQGLCEIAAHQYLRKGHCDEEISRSKDSFDECLRIAADEICRLRTLKDEMPKPNQTVTEERQDLTVDLSVDVARPAKIPVSKPSQQSSMDIIEIDDNGSESDSIQVDLTNFRRTRDV